MERLHACVLSASGLHAKWKSLFWGIEIPGRSQEHLIYSFERVLRVEILLRVLIYEANPLTLVAGARTGWLCA